MKLAEVMEGLRLDALKSLAKRIGVPKTVMRKADVIGAIQDRVEGDLDSFLGQLSDTERLFLAEAANAPGGIAPGVFQAKYQLPAPSSNRWVGRRDASLIHLLLHEDEDGDKTHVADDLAEHLRSRLPKPPAAASRPVDQVPDVLELGKDAWGRNDSRPVHVFEGEKTVFAELRRVLNLVQAGQVRIQEKSLRPTDATVRLLHGVLVAPDFDVEIPQELHDEYTEAAGPVRAHAWAVLVQQCGWAKPRAGRLALTKAGQPLLGDISPAAFRDGFQRMLGDKSFDELNRVNHIRGQTGKGKRYMLPPADRRHAICDSLAAWPVGRWLGFDEAFRFIAASGRELTVTDAPYYLYLSELQYGYLSDADDEIERQYLRAFLMEPLATLGVVDVAYVYPHYLWPELSGHWGADDMDFCGRYDGLQYARLTPLGAYCLGVCNDYQPPAVQRRSLLKVLANRELAVSGAALSPAEISILQLFAEQKSDHLWALDAQRILSYVESGGSVADVRRFLTQNCAEDVPATVEVFLNDLESKLGAAKSVEKALLVEMQDAEVAARVAHDRASKHLCHLAGERYLVVPERDERAFRKALKKLGYVLPR